MKRRLMVLLLVCTFLVTTSTTPSLSENDKRWDLALTYLESNTDYTRFEVDMQTLYDFDNVIWAFVFCLKEHSPDSDGLITGEIDGEGNLLRIGGPSEVSLGDQFGAEIKTCWTNNERPCYEMLYEVITSWQKKTSGMDLSAGENKFFNRYAQLLKLNFVLPEKNWLTQEAAWKKALVFLAENGINVELAELYVHVINACYVPSDIGSAVWCFYFETPNYFTGLAMNMSDREIDKFLKDVEQKMTKLWGSDEFPYHFSIMIDAATGDLIEPPICDFAPVQYHYLDFLIRPDFLLENLK